MPIHLPAQNRRQFLLTVGVGLVACTSESFGNEVDGDLVYLLNDTHIGEVHPMDSAVPSHLRQVVEELVGLKKNHGYAGHPGSGAATVAGGGP